VYATTDPVAMDTIGSQLVDQRRVEKGLPTLAQAGRAPAYIQTAADLGLGVGDMTKIRVREVAI
jgi:hypothetical protein